MATTEFIAAVELGSSKIAGIAGKRNSDGSLQVLACTHEDATAFVRKGAIYNIDKAASALNSIIEKLQVQLGSVIAKIYVGISGKSLHTVKNLINTSVGEKGIVSSDLIDQICDNNRNQNLSDWDILDFIPQEYKIDNTLQIDPVGVAGQDITGNFLNIVARTSLKKNLESSLESTGYAYEWIVSPLVLAKAVLTENDMRAGCALVDFGADTTTVAVYKNNILRYLSVLPIGGNNITHDITSLQMEELEAEDLKMKHGCALNEESNEETPATYTTNSGQHILISDLNNLVEARVEEILLNVWNQIKLSGYSDKLYQGIFFTGGGSNLPKLDEAFKKLTNQEKVKTLGFVNETVHGCSDVLKKDGTFNTLLGLLMAGKDNCCKMVEEKPAEQNQSNDIFANDEDLQKQAELQRKKLEEEKAQREAAEKRRQEELETKKKEEEEKKKKEKKKSSFFRDIFDKVKDSVMDDQSDNMN